MSPEIREQLAKAAYEARRRHINAQGVTYLPEWESPDIPEMNKELDRIEAEAVVLALAEIVLPAFGQVAHVLTGKQVEMYLEGAS